MKNEKMTRPDLYKKLQAELKTIYQIEKDLNNGKIEEKEDHEDNRDPLEITLYKEVKIGLSWVGPADGYKLKYYKNELQSAVYYWQDWGTYGEIELSDKEASTIESYYLYGDPSIILNQEQIN